MIKYLAILAALTMTVAAFTACGDTSDSSTDETTTTTTAAAAAEETEEPSETAEDGNEEEENEEPAETEEESSEAEAETEPDTQDDGDSSEAASTELPAAFDGTKTGDFYKALSSGNFAIEMDAGDEGSVVMELAGKDYHMSYDMGGFVTDMYLVDETMYILDSESKSYSKMEFPEEAMGDTDPSEDLGLDLGEDVTFDGSEEVDGLTCETFTADGSEMKFYFDADGNIKKIESDEETVEITRFEGNISSVALPDLSGWTEESLLGDDSE